MALSSKGASAATASSKNNILNILNQFIEQDAECSGQWSSQSEEDLCSAPFYERFSYFLLYKYVKPAGVRGAGEPLDGDTPKVYLNLAVNLAADKFKGTGTEATKKFFQCLDKGSQCAEALWLRGQRVNITRQVFLRAKMTGKEMDMSEGTNAKLRAARAASASVCTPLRFCSVARMLTRSRLLPAARSSPLPLAAHRAHAQGPLAHWRYAERNPQVQSSLTPPSLCLARPHACISNSRRSTAQVCDPLRLVGRRPVR